MTEDHKILIAPSILSADFGQINAEIATIEPFADWLHLDVMDNHFVPNLTFGPPIIKKLKTGLFKDAHLMVENPDTYLEALKDAGVNSVTVHQETCVNLHRTVQNIKNLGMKAGVSINPGTAVESLNAILGEVDMVLIMSVNPGFGGQSFIEGALDKIKYIKAKRPDVLVEVDGGINQKTAALCREAGADVLVSGSFIFKADNRQQAIEGLRKA